jgi:hypothetical protein
LPLWLPRSLARRLVHAAALGWVQAGEQLVLGDIGVPLDLLEIGTTQ